MKALCFYHNNLRRTQSNAEICVCFLAVTRVHKAIQVIRINWNEVYHFQLSIVQVIFLFPCTELKWQKLVLTSKLDSDRYVSSQKNALNGESIFLCLFILDLIAFKDNGYESGIIRKTEMFREIIIIVFWGLPRLYPFYDWTCIS